MTQYIASSSRKKLLRPCRFDKFAICADYDHNIRVFDSHPTPTKLGGNGRGVVVTTKNPYFIYEWIIKRLKCSKCSDSVTPFLIFVDAERR